MSAKKWLLSFLICILLIASLWAGANVLVDPYGVFGDVIFSWDSYSMTRNPRVGKIEYLKDNADKYDSYVIGCSSTSSWSVDTLNEYFDASFYNMIMYGADMLDVEETVAYLADNYTVKNLVLNVYIDNGMSYDVGEDLRENRMHPAVTGRGAIGFYLEHLFLDPQYAIEKIESHRSDTELPQSFDVFNAETGTYDKRGRDAEPIRDMADYIAKYPVFASYPVHCNRLTKIDETVGSVARIAELCRERGINLTVVTAPVYMEYLRQFDQAEVEEFYTKLAEVTDFWDFTMSSVSCDPRFFYDATHFRNCVGDMALARIFGDESVYVPSDLGVYVTEENVSEVVAGYAAYYGGEYETDCAVSLPVLMYHDIDEEGDFSATISEEGFLEQLDALTAAGFTAVSVEDVINYVYLGAELPEKPVLITFDDGYLSNYDIAWPALRERGMEAAIFVIGHSVGATEYYKDTEYPTTPHFGLDAMGEMADSGVIEIGSHTYDMHQWAPYEAGPARETAERLPEETEADFIAAFKADLARSAGEIEAAAGEVRAFSFPRGAYSDLTLWLVHSSGIPVSVSTDHGINTIIKGLPQSLYALRRINVSDQYTGEELVKLISGE